MNIINISLENIEEKKNSWININDEKYMFLQDRLINSVYPKLQLDDKKILLTGLVRMINFIYIKFGFNNNMSKSDNIFWEQLTQNELLDLRALLNILLPFIMDNDRDDNKHNLKKLEDIYLEKNQKGEYIYSNSQYNRCIRQRSDDDIIIYDRPYLNNYFFENLELLIMTIEMCANKLHVNWIDIIPVKMIDFTQSQLYYETLRKLGIYTKVSTNVELIGHYIDPGPGLSYQDIYNVMSNHLFHEIKNYKWLIYEVEDNGGKLIPYVLYLENIIGFDFFWNNKSWSQIDNYQKNAFERKWRNFILSTEKRDGIVLAKFYYFFYKYHINTYRLIKQKIINKNENIDKEEDDKEEAVTFNEVTIQNMKKEVMGVPIEEIYLFFFHQLTYFKKSWYYYVIKIKGQIILNESNPDDIIDIPIYVTPKNVYNYCKSFVHYNQNNEYKELPRLWTSLLPRFVLLSLIRLLDVEYPRQNNWSENNWFNINNYFAKFYPSIYDKKKLPRANFIMHSLIRTRLVDIIFESLIYHGLLIDYIPNKTITNSKLIETEINTKDAMKISNYKRDKIRDFYFSGKNRIDFEKYAYNFMANVAYGDLDKQKSEDYAKTNYERSYFDCITSDQFWTLTYAMNWVSQINFYHHYINNRVIYVTGATGTGKSTEVPKLFLYSQRMIDFNGSGKIVCTQPRVGPVVENSETISKNMGIPIREYSKLYDKQIFTSNYYIQYKHQKENHLDVSYRSFLKITTDGTLLEEMKNSPFLTTMQADNSVVDASGNKIDWVRKYSDNNKYDIVIVDEAHEHNANMDIILTLARDVCYVNNSIKLVIVSATMESDEPIYRRYYRKINDNRGYPLSAFISFRELDRANVDRRIHISPPGASTQYFIKDIFLNKAESDLINSDNYVEYGIKKTIEVAKNTNIDNILLFLPGKSEINRAVKEINANTPENIIAFGFYRELSEERKVFLLKIHQTLPRYTRYKDDIELEEKNVSRRVAPGTYTRAIIIATNIAEASVTFKKLRYVVDTGYSKAMIYNALEGYSKTFLLPISQASATQRRGRVGRIMPGEVYHMYDDEKIKYNKVQYNIAESDVSNTLLGLLKTDSRDSPIITPSNDINNIRNIINFKNNILTFFDRISFQFMLYDYIDNPRAFMSIITRKYMYAPYVNDIDQYYLYYGKCDESISFNNYDMKKSKLNYAIKNHDDYQYQQDEVFISRCHTGYNNETLEDSDLNFYVIHIDENIIKRNLYTGKMKGLLYNHTVSDAYYYFTLIANGISIRTRNISKIIKNYSNYNNFILLKYSLFVNEMETRLLVMNVPVEEKDIQLKYTDIHNEIIIQHLEEFYKIYFSNYGKKSTIIRTIILSNLSKIQSSISLSILNEPGNLLWCVFSMPHEIEIDVIALMCLIKIGPDIKQWAEIKKQDIRSKEEKDILKFYAQYSNKNGDIFFLYKLWKKIKKLPGIEKLLDQIKIDIQYYLNFKIRKEKYSLGQKIDFSDFLVFDKMYKSGKLNVKDEFYNYINLINIDITRIIEKTNIITYLHIFEKNYGISFKKILEFLIEYLSNIFELNKKIWMNQYEIANQIQIGDIDDEISIRDWAKKLLFPGINTNPNYIPNKWDIIFESYLRAFSTNLLKNKGNYYIMINKGIIINPTHWSKRIKKENTLLNKKSDYIIYHNIVNVKSDIGITYITPVKLEWILNLNPVYYFFLLYNKQGSTYYKADSDITSEVLAILRTNAHLYNFGTLISYLDRLDNPYLTNIIKNKIDKIND